jgi:hypothetical protein
METSHHAGVAEGIAESARGLRNVATVLLPRNSELLHCSITCAQLKDVDFRHGQGETNANTGRDSGISGART